MWGVQWLLAWVMVLSLPMGLQSTLCGSMPVVSQAVLILTVKDLQVDTISLHLLVVRQGSLLSRVILCQGLSCLELL